MSSKEGELRPDGPARPRSSFVSEAEVMMQDLFRPEGEELNGHAQKDEKELIAAVKAMLERRAGSKHLDRSEKDALADDLVSTKGDGFTFHQRLAPIIHMVDDESRQVEVHYRSLTVEADAAIGLSDNPTLWNSVINTVNLLLLRANAYRRPLKILDGVNGALLPGRLTLLIGPPGSGKSVFMQALSGRLRAHRHLRITGDVEYNGKGFDDFVVQRASGMVDQHDFHIPNMTVLETIQFAYDCLTSVKVRGQAVAKLEAELDKVRADLERCHSETAAAVGLEEGLAKAVRSQPLDDGVGVGANGGTLNGGAVDGGGSNGPHTPPRLPGATDSGVDDDAESARDEFYDAASRRASSVSSSAASVYQDAVDGDAGSVAAAGDLPSPLPPNSTAKPPLRGMDSRAVLLRHSSVEAESELKPVTAGFLAQMLEVLRDGVKPFIIMKILGLSHAADTMIGNSEQRGISGGERKRVTTAEVMTGPQMVMMMDEISTGLDSATTFSIVKSLRAACHTLKRTLLVSLLQPPPEVVRLFDDIVILTDGRIIYHGPTESVLDFFEGLGFVCPPRKDPGSFLQEVTTPVGQLTYASRALLEERNIPEQLRDPRRLISQPPTTLLTPVEDMSRAFWEDTEWGRAMMKRVAAGYGTVSGRDSGGASNNDPPGHGLPKGRYANGWLYLTRMVFRRQALLNLVRARGFIIARCVQSVIMALIIGGLFFGIQPGADTWRNAIALCMLVTVFLIMMSTPTMTLIFETKRVFHKHRDEHFFPAWSYACGLLLTQVVPSTLETLFFGIPVYFMSGFQRAAEQFFIFLLVAWSGSNCLAALFRTIAFAIPTLQFSTPFMGLMLLLMMVTNGFTILYPKIPDYIVWLYWANPVAWTVRALVINEMTSPQWDIPSPAPGVPLGVFAMDAFGFHSDRFYIWAAVIFNWGTIALLTVLGSVALTYLDPPKPRATVEADEDKDALVKDGVFATVARMGSLSSRVVSALSMSRSLGKARQEELVSMPTEELQDAAPKHVVIPFTPITLVCRNICYYVPDPARGKGPGRGVVKESGDSTIEGKLQLLRDISMIAEPGVLMALMGGSGAGKTTLMDVVCGRKTIGIVRGDIMVNGHPKNQDTWSRVVGYVEQTDIHTVAVTVEESLLFSARLRLEESVSMDDIRSLVEETLKMIELDRIRGRVVGYADSGLSIEQRKRLSIGVELVANPSVVFMDEPTSGLDARSAAVVMRAIRNVADTQRTVMVTIHQPSVEIFEAFDAMVLLQRGGELTYAGPLGFESADLVAYLESQPGVERLRPGYNPATWMLEVTGGSMSTTFRDAGQDFPKLFRNSALFRDNIERGDALIESGKAAHSPLALRSRFATSANTQRKWLIRKFCKIYWHLPEYNMVRLTLTTLIALIYGAVFWGQGKISPDEPATLQQVQSVTGLIFSMTVFQGMFNCMSIMPLVAAERVVFYRERAASMYSPGHYTMATTIAELPYLLLQTILMVSISYWMVQFEAVAWKFFYFLLIFFLSLTIYTLFGQFLVYLTPSPLLAMLLAAAFNQIWTIFNGFLLPYPSMAVGWKWINRISPTTWSLYGLACSQLCDMDVPIYGLSAQELSLPEFMDSYFGWKYDFIWWCALILLAFVFAFRLGSGFLLSHVNYLRR